MPPRGRSQPARSIDLPVAALCYRQPRRVSRPAFNDYISSRDWVGRRQGRLAPPARRCRQARAKFRERVENGSMRSRRALDCCLTPGAGPARSRHDPEQRQTSAPDRRGRGPSRRGSPSDQTGGLRRRGHDPRTDDLAVHLTNPDLHLPESKHVRSPGAGQRAISPQDIRPDALPTAGPSFVGAEGADTLWFAPWRPVAAQLRALRGVCPEVWNPKRLLGAALVSSAIRRLLGVHATNRRGLRST